MTVLKKATIRSYDAAAHNAAVQIAGSLAVWLDAVRVATNIPAADVVAGRQCSVLFLDPSNQDDAVIIAVQGALPTAGGVTIEEDDSVVGSGIASVLDFTEPDATLVTETPSGEFNVNMGLYALLSGRAGGQTLIGGAASGEDLTLESTSHATKGSIIVNDHLDAQERITVHNSLLRTGYMVNIEPTITGVTVWRGVNIVPDLTLTGNTVTCVGLWGGVNVKPDGATSGHNLFALNFDALVQGTELGDNETITYTTINGILCRPGVVNIHFSGSNRRIDVTNLVAVDARFSVAYLGGGAAGTISNAYTFKAQAPASANVVNYTGLEIPDETAATGNIYLLEIGPATPFLRLLGGGNPGANQTNLYLGEGTGPTLRRVQWKDGASIGSGDRVMVLV